MKLNLPCSFRYSSTGLNFFGTKVWLISHINRLFQCPDACVNPDSFTSLTECDGSVAQPGGHGECAIKKL